MASLSTVLVLSALLAALGVTESLAQGLEAYRYKSRPVMVFAPAPDDRAAADQLKRLKAGRGTLDEREMPVFLVGPKSVTTLAGRRAPTLDAAALRKAYGIGEAAFAVILVGKDGGEKLRSSRPVSAEALTGLVDRMPMRRQEAR